MRYLLARPMGPSKSTRRGAPLTVYAKQGSQSTGKRAENPSTQPCGCEMDRLCLIAGQCTEQEMHGS